MGPELLRALPFTGNGNRGFGYLVARHRYVVNPWWSRC
jgi:hypothetical protein